MKATFMRLVWIAEIIFTGLTSFSVLPTLVLIFADLVLGTSSTPIPRTDAVFFFGLLIGLGGVWIVLLMPDSRYQRNPGLRWVVVAALAVAAAILTWLAWGTVRYADWLSFSMTMLTVGVSLHHFARLIMLSRRVPERNDSV